MSRKESPEEARERMRREVLLEAGQACLDWAEDTGLCHICSYDGPAGKPHDEHCPLRKRAESERHARKEWRWVKQTWIRRCWRPPPHGTR